MNAWVEILAIAAVIGSGLVAGIFFAFSNFVMPALARLPENEGADAMKAINITVLNPLFFTAFIGTAVLCAGLIACVIMGAAGPQFAYLLIASLLYLIGCFLVTGVKNVPLNDRLALAKGSERGDVWHHYFIRWTYWNHVRTVASLLASLVLLLAL